MKRNICCMILVILCVLLTACTSSITEPAIVEDSIAIFATEEDMKNCIQGSYVKLDGEQLSGKGSFLNDKYMTQIVIDGTSYSATITAESGYDISSIVVTMGGVDITSSAVRGSIK